MATHKSAEKRYRQSLTKRSRNRLVKATLRSAITAVRAEITAKDKTKAKAALTQAERLIARAAVKGVLNKGTARRTISRLAQGVAKIA